MVDINLFRTTPDLIRESQRRRGKDVSEVDQIIELDKQWRSMEYDVSENKRARNELSKGFKTAKTKEEKDQLREKSAELKKKIEEIEAERDQLRKKIDDLLYGIGNIVHESVPQSLDEKDNEIIKVHGEAPTPEGFLEHDELLWRIGGFEPEIGTDVGGHRAYYLIGPALWLNQALINYGLQFLHKKGYTTVQTPFFMKKDVMHKVAQLEDYEESLYNVGDDLFLIATSEQPMCGFHLNTNMNPNELPKKFAGFSTNFRKEAGSSGKDVRGIFRVHQFEKVEQFIVTAPDKSWEMHEELQSISEEFYESLGLSYKVVCIVSGALNNAAAKKYDTEAWFPGSKEYRELVSNSNCTDYQSRRLNTKYGTKQKGEKTFVHMLNSTLVATERTLCCLLENYQCEEGIRVPEVLLPFVKPFLGDSDIIPFVRDGYVRDRKGKKKN